MKLFATLVVLMVLSTQQTVAQQAVPEPNFATYTCFDLIADNAKIKTPGEAVTNQERVIASSTVSNMSGYFVGYMQRVLDENNAGEMSKEQFIDVVRYVSRECAKEPERTLLDILRTQTLFKF